MKGSKAHIKKKAIRSLNYSMAAAMNEKSMYFYEVQEKAYNRDDYSDFLVQLFQYLRNDNITGAYLVMDNASFHHSEIVENTIRAHRHHPVFLPAYSPFLSPIEEVFSQVE